MYAKGCTYEDVHRQNRASRHLWEKYIPNTSFKFVVNGYNHSISKARQRQVIEDFSYMGFMGTIDLLNPEVTLGCFEECELNSPLEGCAREFMYLIIIINVCHTDPNGHRTVRLEHKGASEFRDVFFGRLVRRGCWTKSTGFVTLNLPYRHHGPVRARERASTDPNVRRQKATILWQHKHGSRNISSHGKSNLGKYRLLIVTPSSRDNDAPHDTGLTRKVDL